MAAATSTIAGATNMALDMLPPLCCVRAVPLATPRPPGGVLDSLVPRAPGGARAAHGEAPDPQPEGGSTLIATMVVSGGSQAEVWAFRCRRARRHRRARAAEETRGPPEPERLERSDRSDGTTRSHDGRGGPRTPAE